MRYICDIADAITVKRNCYLNEAMLSGCYKFIIRSCHL